jgi:hypothetical protein
MNIVLEQEGAYTLISHHQVKVGMRKEHERVEPK